MCRILGYYSITSVHVIILLAIRHMEIYKKHSVASVREQTIPTERSPLIGEVSANLCALRVSRGQRDGSLLPYSRLSRPEQLLRCTHYPDHDSRVTISLKIW
jgi:hypothetical protein